MISEPDRRQTIELIEEAREGGARLIPACQVLKISARTYQRWTKDGSVSKDRRPDTIRPVPANKLTAEERRLIATETFFISDRNSMTSLFLSRSSAITVIRSSFLLISDIECILK